MPVQYLPTLRLSRPSFAILWLIFAVSFFMTPARAEKIFVPLVFSTPDTGVAAGAAAIWVTPNPRAGENKNDTLRTFGFFTQKGQMMLSVGAGLYREQGQLLLEPSLVFGKSSETSHGLGAFSLAEAEENYDTEFVNLKLKAGWSLPGDSYLGPAFQLQGREYTRLSSAPELRDYLTVNDEMLASTRVGLGLHLKRDTRDNSFYSQNGAFSEAELIVFDQHWGSDYNFTLFEMEHRRFIALDARSVLAVQGRINAAGGQVPYDQMPAIGGAQSLRGVLQDRYRDKVALSAQVEWRRILSDTWGVAVFAGAGDVAPAADKFQGAGLKYALGAGGRYALGQQQRINLRLDFGYSDALGDAEGDGFNVYFQIGEAF